MSLKLFNILSGNLIKTRWTWPRIYSYFNSNLNYRNTKKLDIPLVKEEIINSGINLRQFEFKPRNMELPVTIIIPGRITKPKNVMDGSTIRKGTT